MKREQTHVNLKSFLIDHRYSTVTKTFDIEKMPNVETIDGGTLVGEITASSKARLYTKAAVKTAGTAITEIELNNGTAEELKINPFVQGDTVDIGSNTGLTVNAVDYNNMTITVSTSIDVSQGDEVKGTDGSEKAVGLLVNPMSFVGQFSDEDYQEAIIDRGVVDESLLWLLDDDAKSQLRSITFRNIQR